MSDMLVVDDDRTIGRLLTDFLRHRGHQVWDAGSGTEALALAGERRFDVIFLDIVMPGMSGIEVLRRLKDLAPSTAIIMISGISDETTAVESMALGAADFIRKPFDLEYLDRVVLLKLALAA